MRNSLRVRTQLVLLSGTFIALLLMVAGLGYWQTWQQSQSMRSLYEDRVVPLRQIKSVSDMYAVNIVDTVHKFADGSLTSDQSLASLDQAVATIQRDWSAYQATYLVPEERALIDKLKPLMAAADGLLPELRQAIQTGDRAGVANIRATRLYPVFDPMQGVIGDLMALQLTVAKQINAESAAAVGLMLVVMLGATACSIATGLGLSIWIMRHLARQLGAEPHEVRTVAEAVARGDLSSRIVTAPGHEQSVMASMQRMSQQLSLLVKQVRECAESVQSTGNDMATSTQHLSRRTEEQATALEETAASMEEIGSTVRQTADTTMQANALAQEVVDEVGRSGSEVDALAQTMGKIGASSSRITEIVGVIDTIAFQTNILALNAAVEAARAGEQGRGFAVVATEVRQLAQRSAAAAQEVRSLILGSHEAVQQGSQRTTSAAAAVRQSIESMKRLTHLVSEISIASREQHTGLAQINSATSQIDQSTQQTVALVEESAAAASQLREQATRLVDLVSTFKLPMRG